MEFVHLHVHSHYTAEDGVASVRDLVRAAREVGQKALALTDLHTLAGIPAFCLACEEFGIRPVLGCEFNLASHDSKVAADAPFRLVLLVENETGYRNLVALVNRAHFNARRQTPSLRTDDLQRHSSGLIALFGGPHSELYSLLQQGRLDETEACVARLARIFGRDNLVFTIQDHNLPRQKQVNDRLYSLAEYLGVRCIATNSVCYLRPEDSLCHDFLTQERPPAFLNFDAARNGAFTRHVASADEMLARFRKFPKAVFTTADLAERCTFVPNFARKRFPEHDFVRGFDADSYLWDLVFREARERLFELRPEMKTRLNEEFDYIKTHGLSNNVLLLWNIAQFCHKNRISMGIGTGNMISSLVAFILGITRINPLDYKLRFLGFGEGEGEDLQMRLEIPPRHGRALQAFLREEFGAEHCSAIGRTVWQQRQQVVREIRTWFNNTALRPDSVADQENLPALRKFTCDDPMESFFPGRVEGVALPCPEVVRFMMSRLLPRPRDLAVEENEFVISGENLDHITPRVMLDGEAVTQFDVPALEMFHIPRLILTANPVLNILDGAAGWVRQEENTTFDPDAIPMDDPETYDLLGKGLTSGIDPFHSITLKSLLRTHRPRNFMGLMKIKSMERSSDRERDPDVREHVPMCLLTYRCAFIKAHYPVSFMASLLSNACLQSGRDRRKFTIILREVKRMGIRVLPPDINLSVYEFARVQKGIRTGLMVVGGLGEKAYAELERVRRGGDFHDLLDLIRRTDAKLINNRILANLVRVGALDGLGLSRAQMLKVIADHSEDIRKGGSGPSLFDGQEQPSVAALDVPAMAEMSPDEVIRHELQAAGYSISSDEFHLYREQVRLCRALTPGALTSRLVGREVYLAGYVDHVETDTPLLDDREHVLLDLEGHVVTMPLKAARLYEAAIHANAPVLLGGLVARRKDELYLKAVTAFTLKMVQEMSERVVHLDLDLAGEDSRTLRLIARLARRHRGGGTTLRIHGFQPGFLDRWHLAAIRRAGVFFCPPLYYALKKILPEARIRIGADDQMDAHLLHALSPQHFPASQAETSTGPLGSDSALSAGAEPTSAPL